LSTDWNKIKVVIFDVDGTLYTQSRLRKKMLLALMTYYVLRPWRLKEMLILHHFRTERERTRAQYNDLENAQYLWCAEKGNYPIELIKKVVDHWIFHFPVKYLKSCVYPGTKAFFEALKQHNIKIAIYSDYKAHSKLKAMDLEADMVISSTDPEIDRLKPDPKGLLHISQQLNIPIEECLFIGDRQELDGESAVRANMPYMIVDKKPFTQFDFYHKLKTELHLTKQKQNNGSNNDNF
jgi:phosphoglycolate phosphatase/putative hydrolase of the HAD superfamily